MTSSRTGRKADRLVYPLLQPHSPVLRRGPGTLQIGLDQEPALILADVGPDLEQVLALLDGCHHIVQIRQRCGRLGLEPDLLDWALRTLDQAGLLFEGGRQRRPVSGSASNRTSLGRTGVSGRRMRLIGAGRLGRAVGELLCASGVGGLHVIDNDGIDAEVYPASGALGSQAEALRSLLLERADARVIVENHWSKPEGVRLDLTVVASDTLECDRVLAEGLMRDDQPHLLIRARAGGVVVGPFVVPGQTACLRCTDLARRTADPAWPTLLSQLVRMRTPIEPALVAWAGSVAATQALAFLGGGVPETCGATLEISPTDFVMRRRTWQMHPGCGCAWGLTAQWRA